MGDIFVNVISNSLKNKGALNYGVSKYVIDAGLVIIPKEGCIKKASRKKEDPLFLHLNFSILKLVYGLLDRTFLEVGLHDAYPLLQCAMFGWKPKKIDPYAT